MSVPGEQEAAYPVSYENDSCPKCGYRGHMTSEVDNLVQRVARLERRNRHLKMAGLGIALATITFADGEPPRRKPVRRKGSSPSIATVTQESPLARRPTLPARR